MNSNQVFRVMKQLKYWVKDLKDSKVKVLPPRPEDEDDEGSEVANAGGVGPSKEYLEIARRVGILISVSIVS